MPGVALVRLWDGFDTFLTRLILFPALLRHLSFHFAPFGHPKCAFGVVKNAPFGHPKCAFGVLTLGRVLVFFLLDDMYRKKWTVAQPNFFISKAAGAR
jgi:hypothetical protein